MITKKIKITKRFEKLLAEHMLGTSIIPGLEAYMLCTIEITPP